jgi:hypothetical protein
VPAGDGEPLKAELPRETRLRIRVLGGSFKMLAAQLRDFGPALTALVGLPSAEAMEYWQNNAEQAHANSVDTPEPARDA